MAESWAVNAEGKDAIDQSKQADIRRASRCVGGACRLSQHRGVELRRRQATDGVGARRHCDLAPFGELEETIKEWDEPHRLVVSIDSAKKLPIAHGLVTFVLVPAEDATETSIEYAYKPKFGLLGQIMGSLALDGQLTKGFNGFLKDLDAASRR
jgi:hypothetical protein